QDEGGGRGEEGENAREGRARPPEGPRGGCWGGRAPSFDPCASGLAGRRAESGAAAIALPRAAPNTGTKEQFWSRQASATNPRTLPACARGCYV
ncbi:unnamed protein product, partial [Prorocentrum cordatum]